MRRRESLAPARDVAARRERDAATALAAARNALAEARARLEYLLALRAEYAAAMAERPGGAAHSAALLKDGACFLARLDGGIGQAQAQVVARQRDCEQRQAAWLGCRVRTRVIDKVGERLQTRAELDALRREQNEQDEFAGRGER